MNYNFPTLHSGVYVLYMGDKIQYIGETKNLYMRIGQHIKRNEIPFNSFAFFDENDLLNSGLDRYRVEYILIRTYNPPYNTQYADNITSWSYKQRLNFAMFAPETKEHLANFLDFNCVQSVVEFIKTHYEEFMKED